MLFHRFMDKKLCQCGWLIALMLAIFPAPSRALPARLVLALDGIAYRDLTALQAGIIHTNFWGNKIYRRAFTADEGYFPVSRMISTFPSASDVAWTDIFGNRPLPGYQRTYFCEAANSQVSINGVTTTMEHERQMQWQEQNGVRRALGYLFPLRTYENELHAMVEHFWNNPTPATNFYAYIRASDDAQHLDCDVFAMLCQLDQQLQALRARYQTKTGRDLQIVILSDHGHNHAGRGQRVAVRAFLEQAGYRVATAIVTPKDVVLPTVGVESWVEIHNSPVETEALVQKLCHLDGVDILTAPATGQTNQFLVMNSQSERAVIDWNPKKNSFRYSPERGDPLNYRPVIKALAQNHQLDADGFATAEIWMDATMTHHYPLALERIVRGHRHNTLNPATILVSLDNRFVHDSWWVQKGSRLVTCRSTHGGLDDLCSDGILLSNFIRTRDTSTVRVAGQFDNFAGLKNFRAEENDAEWVAKPEQAQTRIAHVPFDREYSLLPDDGIYLRIWSPQFTRFNDATPVAVVIEKAHVYGGVSDRRGNHPPAASSQRHLIFDQPITFPEKAANERIYALPAGLILAPLTEYKISGEFQGRDEAAPLFVFNFRTGADGKPLAY